MASDFPGSWSAQEIRQNVELKEEVGLVTKSVFRSAMKKRALSILLVEETGGGKTAFVSLMLNLLQGNDPFELDEQHCVDSESGLDKSQSQTSKARIYTVTTIEGVKFQIIDTPGLADTRGINENMKNKEKTYRAPQEHVTTVDGIMLVANGRVQRLTVSMSYTLETLATLFPQSIKDNLGIIFTSVEADGLGLAFHKACLPPHLQDARHWCLDNPLSLYHDALNSIMDQKATDKQKSKRTERFIDRYNETVDSLDNWLEWLDNREAIPTITLGELYHKSTQIESCLYQTTISLDNLSNLRKKLQDIIQKIEYTEKKKEEHLDTKRSNQALKVWEMIETSDYNTICIAQDCHSNCHLQCTLALYDPESLGGWCSMFKTIGIPNRLIPFMSDSTVKCWNCKHEAAAHRSYRKLHEERPSKTYQEAVQMLEDAKKSENAIKEAKRDILRLVEELNNVSFNPNYANYIPSGMKLLELRRNQVESSADPNEELPFCHHVFPIALDLNANGSPEFTGIRMKYSPEYMAKKNDPASFTVLAPGQSREVVHDLAGIEALDMFHYVDEAGRLASLNAVSEPSVFELTGNLVPHKTSSTPSRLLRSRQSGLSFHNCNQIQQQDITRAITDAETYIAEARLYFQTHNAEMERYSTWFGQHDSTRYDSVSGHFKKIQHESWNTLYDCNCNMANVYAYVYPDRPRVIHICPAFWDAPAVGTDSKAGTLIHEQTHFTKNGGTRDYTYGQSSCRNLAKSHPGKAVQNADNHEFFAENPPQ
ncbi:unnamed protein product [Rhizoctonia solani]|uniref:Lysine-specific metallo-endopeptidase domain-containing protein n=1 Tax=Rhizoctonia solani TaxID=456999 RepID=A0A8H2X2N9_9AGAM|nr:unnamed protein product [Rhizoctonia solani]